MRQYELTPQYDSRASFYGKARVRINKHGDQILTSYETDVAVISDRTAKVDTRYQSATTLRHIKEFLKQHGFKAESQQQILKDYGQS